jgi:predicted RNA-binding protein associated with RNAse of E/G family
MPEPRWSPGDEIVFQEVWRGRLWSARPMTVVEDRGDRVALWLPYGTRWMAPVTRGERIVTCLEFGDWVLDERRWDLSSIWLLPADARHSVLVSWLPDGDFFGWYVNLQTPFTRTARGLQWMDLMLDVVIDPDRGWRWKDEDELQAAVDRDLISRGEASALRAEAESVIAQLEANAPPFSEPWPDWRPDPAWAVPSLRDGWDRV